MNNLGFLIRKISCFWGIKGLLNINFWLIAVKNILFFKICSLEVNLITMNSLIPYRICAPILKLFGENTNKTWMNTLLLFLNSPWQIKNSMKLVTICQVSLMTLKNDLVSIHQNPWRIRGLSRNKKNNNKVLLIFPNKI